MKTGSFLAPPSKRTRPHPGAPGATGSPAQERAGPTVCSSRPVSSPACSTSWNPRRWAFQTASNSSGSASPATAHVRGRQAPRRPVRLARSASHAAAAPSRVARSRRDRAVRARRERSPACSSATRTGTTPSTRPRSPGASRRPAYGSDSLARLMRLQGRRQRRRRAATAATSSARSWSVSRRSRHSKLLFGRKVPFDGPLTCEDVHAIEPGRVQVRRGVRDPDRGRGDQPLPPGQRRPATTRSCGTSRSTCSSRVSPGAR